MIEITHRQLCKIGGSYMRRRGIVPYYRCSYVVIELEHVGECPDVWGVSSGQTQLIEVKVSRSDFLADKKKYHRINPEVGLGAFRSYLCPSGIINIEDLPKYWGLLWFDGRDIVIKKYPERQPCSFEADLSVLMAIMRREGLTPKIYDYKKYKNEQL